MQPIDFYNIFSELTTEERQIWATWRDYLADEIVPMINPYWEKGEFPKEILPRLGQVVWDTISDRKNTFAEQSPLLAGILSMELGRQEPSINTFTGVTLGLCGRSIEMFGSAAQKERWLVPLLKCEAVGSWALTEPEAGSDAAMGLRTTATKDGDSWVLNGSKKWSGNATFADVNCIWAKNSETGQVNGFLVELNTPGYTVEKLEGKIAKRAVENVLITLENCRISDENRLPGVNSFRDVGRQLASARAAVAWEACGLAMGAYEHALAYCKQRTQFGKPIASYQMVQHQLVKMLGNITAMQGMLLQMAKQDAVEGMASHERASLAKAWCTEKMRETVAMARAVLGGNGILLEYHVARLFADAEAVYSYEGSYEMNTLIVGRAITGHSAFA